MLSELSRCTHFYKFGLWFDSKIPSDQPVFSMSGALPRSTWLLWVGRGKLSDTRNLALSLHHFSHVSDLEEGHSPKHCIDKCMPQKCGAGEVQKDKHCLGFTVQIALGTEKCLSIFLIPDIPGSIGRGCFIFKINKFL